MAERTYMFRVAKPDAMMSVLKEKRAVLRYMDENWGAKDWERFYFAPEELQPHDIWVVQLLRYDRMDN